MFASVINPSNPPLFVIVNFHSRRTRNHKYFVPIFNITFRSFPRRILTQPSGTLVYLGPPIKVVDIQDRRRSYRRGGGQTGDRGSWDRFRLHEFVSEYVSRSERKTDRGQTRSRVPISAGSFVPRRPCVAFGSRGPVITKVAGRFHVAATRRTGCRSSVCNAYVHTYISFVPPAPPSTLQ